ncbi:MAG: RNA polymerase-binding protein RbpA [Mobiluncus porci]|uniref:RNA polymerase-binding protein RbpA n=1 Tax=Mobiluncus TaxID=2050 RepID=UPI0023F37FE0|nr:MULTISPECIES: RNA polymerase-binding protein RbpA [Mobiluncus]MCI6585374.1 RNA polymerase-binding protein RbpA [Mobiluncus sp.]MDD7541417.1 RNA polymerase-binding protein RbpA [Mobiluncus porci]MDY5748402.1 RNA polymerase-binding protein RbpA [Mobiluncus porci]
MADRALRGTHMGSTSLESEEGVVFVERQNVDFTCPSGHTFEITFAIDAEVPDTWECPLCSKVAIRNGVEDFQEEKSAKPQRTHWEQLMDRRTMEQLQILLDERLEVYRSGRRRPGGY